MSREPNATLRSLVKAKLDCRPKSYWRAATQRLEVARFLMNKSQYYLDAVYLAGYAVECALKSLILKSTPEAKWPAVSQEISSGVKAHDPVFLVDILHRTRCVVPKTVRANLEAIGKEWSTDLRYVGARLSYKESAAFIVRAEQVYQWVERSVQ